MNLNNRETKVINENVIEETYLEALDNYNDCITIYIENIIISQVINAEPIMGYKVRDDSYTFNNLHFEGIVNFYYLFNNEDSYNKMIDILKKYKIAMDSKEFYGLCYEQELEDTKERFIKALLQIHKTFLS